jgi:hypothetical protein
MAERLHDSQFPSTVHERLSDEGLPHNFGTTATMIARCVASQMRHDQEVNTIDLASCTGIERTKVYHHLQNLVRAGLLEELLPTDGENGGRPRASYTASRPARPAFDAMPSFSGLKLEFEQHHPDGVVATGPTCVAGCPLQALITPKDS